jgi:hypothetical protein
MLSILRTRMDGRFGLKEEAERPLVRESWIIVLRA